MKVKIIDGAYGTNLSHLGPNIEELNHTHQTDVIALHHSYDDMGVNLVKTNSFSLHPINYITTKQFEMDLELALDCTKSIISNVLYDVGPLHKLMAPYGDLTSQQVIDNYKKLADCLYKHTDMFYGILFETFQNLQELKLAIITVRSVLPNIPIFATMTFEKSCRTLFGDTPECVALTLNSLNVTALGVNCSSDMATVKSVIKKMYPYTSLPLIASPNKGVPGPDGVHNMSDERFVEHMEDLVSYGVEYVGSCCGSTPNTSKLLVSKFRGSTVAVHPRLDIDYLICSRSKILDMRNFSVCGERVNPTGRKVIREALRTGDISPIIEDVQLQTRSGADYLDINLSTEYLSDQQAFIKHFDIIQSVTDLPLQIDTQDFEAFKEAFVRYPGIPVFNSINLDTVNGSILKYLRYYRIPYIFMPTLNGESGSIEAKIKNIHDFLRPQFVNNKTINYLIPDSSFPIVDLVINSASSTKDSLKDAIRLIKLVRGFNVPTTAGVSNISFSMSNRPLVNSMALSTLISSGLTHPIINVMDSVVNESLTIITTLLSLRERKTPPVSEMSLKDHISYGIIEGVDSKIKDQDIDTLLADVITEKIKMYKEGQVTLSELIASSEVANYLLRNKINNSRPILLASAKGDNHDLGKKIVAQVLKANQFNVIDLGKDVPNEDIIKAIKMYDPIAVGISSLLTTSLTSISNLVEELKKQNIVVPLWAGGAVVSKNYTDYLGILYGGDALDTLNLVIDIQLNG